MKKLDFNRHWRVQRDGSDAITEVNLPHDAMIYETRSADASTGAAGGYFPSGKYIYMKTFVPSPDWTGKTVIFECETVYQNASVLLNDELLYERPYGYTNFFVDLSEHLKFGEENVLTIIADNGNAPNSRWYSGSGVYRPVYLYIGKKTCILPDTLKVTTLDEKTIRADAEGLPDNAKLQVQILEGGKIIAESSANHALITIPDAKLWSSDQPYLYTCQVSLLSDEGDVLDTAQTRFGMRLLSWSDGAFKVNGEAVKLRGACVHHDNGILGAACFADAEGRRVRILKEAGFNAIRCAHNPMSRAMLDACDELGMYVMDESWDMWTTHKNPYDYAGEKFKAWWKEDLSAMIAKDYNHPSVVMYSVGNEISELGLSEGQSLCEEITAYAKSLDDTRPLTSGLNLVLSSMAAKKAKKGKETSDQAGGAPTAEGQPTSIFFNMLMNKLGTIMDKMASQSGATKIVEKVAPMLDIPGYNYATSRYKKDCGAQPGRVIVGSETLPKYLYKNWQLVKAYPNLAGDFMWTGWDYLGESGIGTVTYKESKKGPAADKGLVISGGAGVVDICGKPRAEVGWNKSIWGLKKEPTIGVEPVTHANHVKAVSMWRNTDAVESWAWEGCEGDKTDIVVYTNAEKVTLSLNGHKLGTKKVKENMALFKGIEYQPGCLEAIAYDASGRKVSESMLQSAKGASTVRLRADKETLRANGQDLCFIDLEIVGENGIVKASCDTALTIEIEGAGTLQAFGSARPNMQETFTGKTHTTYYGRALAAIRAGYEAGEIRVRVSGEGMTPAEITISCVGCEE